MRRVIEVDGLFDGTRAIANAAIVVGDGIITWAGPRSKAPKTPRGERSEVVKALGAFALPGLVNCHAHLTLDGSPQYEAEVAQHDALATLKAFKNARTELRSGVTTVRDLSAKGSMVIELGRAAAGGVVEGPRIIACGRGITSTGGHAHEFGGVADGEVEVRKAVRTQLAAGATVIKIFSTGGVLGEGGAGPESTQYTEAEIRAAVEEAHRGGVRITTHAHGAMGMRLAALAGIDSIEHATLLDAKTIALVKEKGVALVPTFSALAGIMEHQAELPSYVVDRSNVVASRHQQGIRDARKAGITIAAGTDAGTPFNRHDRFAREIDLLQEIGMSATEALTAATRVAADVVGAPQAGRIEAGAYADLLFVDDDPTKDTATLHRPKDVWVRGAPIERPGTRAT